MLTLITRATLIALLAGLLQLVTVTPASAATPKGVLDAISSPAPGKVYVKGWAFDPDDPVPPVTIHVCIRVCAVDIGRAELSRPDVGREHPEAGPNHGFETTISVPDAGNVYYEVYAIDGQDPSTNTLIGAGYIDIADTLSGALEVASSTVHRTIDVSGWASDSDAPASPVEIHVYVGGDVGTPGVERHVLSANVRRSDGRLGFSARLPTAKTGAQQLTIYAVNLPDTAGPHARVLGTPQVTVYVDTVAPQTKITSAPRTATTDDLIHVTFSSNEPNSTFQCRWDEEEWFTCADGTAVKLTVGNHRIAVRATDAAGNRDPDPAVWVVTVTQAPTPTDPNAPTPTDPGTQTPGTQTGRSIVAKAVKKKSRLRINVGPDSATTNYRVIIQRKVGKKWRKITRTRTRGPKDIVTINLKRGTYRAVLPKSSAGKALRSNTIRLKR